MMMVQNKQGFTFVEVLVTLVILSTGIIAILQSFLKSLDYIKHINNRMYAIVLLDDRTDTIQRMLNVYKTLPMSVPEDDREYSTESRRLEYDKELRISEINDFMDIFQLDISVSWKEGGRNIRLSRQSYLSDFMSAE